jgi:signal transduction histidine kinase
MVAGAPRDPQRSTQPPDPARRRNSRLLGAALLIMTVVFGSLDLVSVSTISGYVPPWYGYAFLLAGWLLNRSGRYTLAAAVALSMFPIVIFAGILGRSGGDPKASLTYLLLGVMFAGILLPARGTALFAAACIGSVLLLPLLAPRSVPSVQTVLSPVALLAIAMGLAIVSILHRDQIERERQAALRSSEERLRLAFDAREALIQELAAKNRELERFTYTVSHDLKSPLITIRGFLGSIQSDVAGGRSDRLHQDVARVLSATDRMQVLLDELLNLSRVGRIANPKERVAFEALAGESVESLRARLDARGVVVEIEPGLPEVYGDRVRLAQLLQNLVENAAKFLGDQQAPRVRIGARTSQAGALPVLFVSDNGIGIDPSHHEKVFGLFERLDPRVEGTGFGLTLARRIVEVHGGRIWIESAGLGHGTSVCFTLASRPGGAEGRPDA